MLQQREFFCNKSFSFTYHGTNSRALTIWHIFCLRIFMAFEVLVTANIDPAGMRLLRSNGFLVHNEEGVKLDSVADHVQGCHAVLTRTELIDAAVYEAAPELAVVAKHGVGVDNIDVETACRLGIQVVYAPESNIRSVVEHTQALILGIAKNLYHGHRATLSGDFSAREHLGGFELGGKTLGLVGTGRIGREVGTRCARGFDMRVIAYDPFVDRDCVPPEINFVDNLDDLLSAADFVSLHLPLTQKTRRFIGPEAFGRMKASAFLVNAARGPIVDESALIAALKNRDIAGAALDVFEMEPPARDNPLFKMDNVLLSPHIAALTREAKANMSLHAAMGIVEILHGQAPSWPVNSPRISTQPRRVP